MADTFSIEAIRQRIEAQMTRRGMKPRGLSIAAGLGPTGIRDLMKTPNPGIGTLHKVADALKLPIEELTGAGGVPLVGKIGAGGQVSYFPEEHEHALVMRPPVGPGPLVAFEVSGESMLPKYEPGDVIYVRRDHDGVLPGYLGKYCAVHLTDGGTYIKRLAAGSIAGRYTLQSLNAGDMENVEVVWASVVLFIMPRRDLDDEL